MKRFWLYGIITTISRGVVLRFCPNWVYDISVSRAASEFLSSELTLDAFAKKYSEGLSLAYSPVSAEAVKAQAEEIMMFLSEVDAGEMATELLNSFSYFRLYYEAVGRPRKLKPLFGSIEDPVKNDEVMLGNTTKAFRAYVFALRSKTVPEAPPGWRLEDEENVPNLAELASKTVSLLDSI